MIKSQELKLDKEELGVEVVTYNKTGEYKKTIA
jgi:hypothetical protein